MSSSIKPPQLEPIIQRLQPRSTYKGREYIQLGSGGVRLTNPPVKVCQQLDNHFDRLRNDVYDELVFRLINVQDHPDDLYSRYNLL